MEVDPHASTSVSPQPADYVRHNHLTRDIKPKGECPACDEYHAETEPEIERREQSDGPVTPNEGGDSVGS